MYNEYTLLRNFLISFAYYIIAYIIFVLFSSNKKIPIRIILSVFTLLSALTALFVQYISVNQVAAVITISISSFFLILVYIKKTEADRKTNYLDNEIKNQQSNFEKTSTFFRSIAKIEHDNKNHLHYIKACLKENRFQETIEYIDRILQNKVSDVTIVNTGNLLIDTLLSNAIQVSKEYNITFDYNTFLNAEEITTDNYDLCVVLSNALDNAIEACKRINDDEKKHIKVKIICERKELIIKIQNSTDADIKIKNGKFATDKHNKIAHGIGLGNIEIIAEKYGGEVVTKLMGHTFYFAVLLPQRPII